MAADFTQKHKLYEMARAARERALDFYEGGARIEGREKYLTRHPYETDKQYQIRLERSAYRNFAAPIVDVFSSFVCGDRPARTLPEQLSGMAGDVDRRQNDADNFFANQARLAAACGASFTLCDMEPARGRTVAEDRLAGRRALPYFTAIDPDDVYDWSVDARGLAWVVIHSVEALPSEPFARPLCRDMLTVWTRSLWRRYAGRPREEHAADGLILASYENMVLESEGAHPLGEVPLASLLFEPVTPMTGNPVTDDVLSLILRVYRRDSELDKALFDCAVPLAIVNGLEVEQKDSFVRASSNMLMSSDINGISAQYLEPGGQSFAALREALASDIQSIQEIAMRMVKPQSAQIISAEAKSIDRQQLDTQLANFARRCANAEKKCWTLAWKWLNGGQEPASGEIETPYNEDYSPARMEKLDNAYLLEMYNSGAICLATYLGLLKKSGALGPEFDAEKEAELAEAGQGEKSGEDGIDRLTRKRGGKIAANGMGAKARAAADKSADYDALEKELTRLAASGGRRETLNLARALFTARQGGGAQ